MKDVGIDVIAETPKDLSESELKFVHYDNHPVAISTIRTTVPKARPKRAFQSWSDVLVPRPSTGATVEMRRACSVALATGLSVTFVIGGVVEQAGASSDDLELVTVDSAENPSNNNSANPMLSADSRFVAFNSDASNLAAGGTGGAFVRDRLLGTTERVGVDSAGVPGSGFTWMPSLSEDGRFVAFFSDSPDLVEGDTNGVRDVFVRDRRSPQTTRRVSIADTTNAQANGPSSSSDTEGPAISANGRYVVFSSNATNLVPGDTNGKRDYFRRDLWTSETVLITVSTAGVQADDDTYDGEIWGPSRPSISADGNLVAFATKGGNITPGAVGSAPRVYVRDVAAGTTELVSQRTDGTPGDRQSFQPVISADGRYVAFASTSNFMAPDFPGGEWHVYRRDRQSPTFGSELVSVSSSGVPSSSYNRQVAMSPDGNRIAWDSDAGNLVAGDNNGVADAFVRDMQTGTTERMSVTAAGGQSASTSGYPALSKHPGFGVFLAFGDDLVAGDTNTKLDVVAHMGYDLTPPTVTPGISGTLGANGWYTSDVSVSWTLEDLESSVVTQENCGNTLVNADTTAAGMTLTCSAMSAARPTSQSVTIKRDATVPTIGHTVAPASPNGLNGWYVTAPTVSYACDDAAPGSGLTACLVDGSTPPGPSKSLDESPSAQSVSGTAADGAGNQAFDSVSGLKVDLSNPVVTCAPTLPVFTLNEVGAVVSASVSDAVSGATAPTTTSPANTSRPGTFVANLTGTDNAGRSTTISCPYNVIYARTIVVGDVSVLEGNTGTKTANMIVSLSTKPRSGHTVSVQVATANGTATSGTDYSAVGTTTLTWTSTDPLTKTVPVTVTGDALKEGNETFTVNLSGPTNAVLADASGLVTVIDEEGSFYASVANASVTEGNSGTKTMSFNVSLSAAPAAGQTVTVKVASANGTSSAGTDYTAVPLTTLTFAPGEKTKPVSVTVKGDTTSEPNETLVLNLSAPSPNTVIADSQGSGTIINDDGTHGANPARTVAVSDVSVLEGNSATRTAAFSVTLSAKPPAGQTTTVKFATANGTATSGTDYAAQPLTTLTWNSTDALTKVVGIVVSGDIVKEGNETFTLNLSAPTNATLADAAGRATIIDEEGTLNASVKDTSVTEGNSGTTIMTFTIALSGAPATAQTVGVNASTSDGTAFAPGDYSTLTTTVSFTAGQTTKTVNVTINGDTTAEPQETLKVNLSSPTANLVIADATGIGTIINDD